MVRIERETVSTDNGAEQERRTSVESGSGTPRRLTRIERRLIDANGLISQEPPDRVDFLHTCLCQVGLPRRRVEGRSFERHSGHVSIRLDAGTLFNGVEFIEQPLPYGVTPRLVMVQVSSEAVRTRSRTIGVGDSMRQFLNVLGIPTSGGERGGYTAFKRQMEALAACRLTLGMQSEGRVVTVDAKPIDRFDAWLHIDGGQRTLWPGTIELSERFYTTLAEHAVPLDYRALAALRHSSLAIDTYSWLAHRLRRVAKPQGVKVSWHNLREQFGQEYTTSKNFKREFRRLLGQVCRVYPDARIQEVPGGLILYPSKPPLAPTRVALSLPITGNAPVDKQVGS